MGVELEAPSGRERKREPAAEILSAAKDLVSNMAEANGSRTHHRYREITTAGFEDRDDHRTACASASVRIIARAASFSLSYRDRAAAGVGCSPAQFGSGCPERKGQITGTEAGPTLFHFETVPLVFIHVMKSSREAA